MNSWIISYYLIILTNFVCCFAQTHLIHKDLNTFFKNQNYLSSVSQCSGNVEMERNFLKKGFHRELQTAFQVIEYPSENLHSCKIGYWLLIEEFPPEIFLDLYQLGELERLGLVKHHVITAEMDLEKPAYHPNITYSYVGVLFNQEKNQVSFNFSIPLHFRYQKPSDQELFSEFTLHKPNLLFTCLETKPLHPNSNSIITNTTNWYTLCVSPFKNKSIKDLDLTEKIPVGSLQHSNLVSFLTLGITSFASIFLVYLLYFKSPKRKND